MKKRGLSMIVTSLIIILLVIVAIGILYVAYINFVRTGAGGISLGKFTINLEIESAYIDAGDVKVGVKRNAGKGDLIAINFVIEDEDNSEISRKETTLPELGKETFPLTLSELDIDNVETVSIAPIYKSDSGEEVTGDIVDTRKISREGVGGENGGGNGNGNGGGGTGDPDTGFCGDNLIQTPNAEIPPIYEVCDMTSLGGESCETQGYLGGGTISCSSDCQSYDYSSCISLAPPSCNGTWNPPEDAGVECDGGTNCNADCTCPAGFTADGLGGCDLNDPVNQGDVFSVWPDEGSTHRFKSPDLPKDQLELMAYTSYYVNFSNSPETRCFRIQSATYFDEDINVSEISLMINLVYEPLANVSQGQQYRIWEAQYCGQ